MSVQFETTLGTIVFDLVTDKRQLCTNFLKLCKVKAYNWSLFYHVEHNYVAQCNASTSECIWHRTGEQESPFFTSEPTKSRIPKGSLAMALAQGVAGSNIVVTLGEIQSNNLSVFGQVVEGHEILTLFNTLQLDDSGQPLIDVIVHRVEIIDDPFDDPINLDVPKSPKMPRHIRESTRKSELNQTDDQTMTRGNALALEILGDIPHADAKPPENILFICKLNPITQQEDLKMIFSRFGRIKSCEIVKDKITNESLSYAFIEFEDKRACEMAYFKMNNVLIDDRRIRVDFSQSVGNKRRKPMSHIKRAKNDG